LAHTFAGDKANMKIPKQVKIGGFLWTIEENDKVSIEGNVFGSTHCVKQRIFLDPNETQQKKEQCLLHEIMHAIFWQTGLNERIKKPEHLTEEELIQALSFGVYQVLKDNNLLK
jgi:hypothetical protein